MELRVVALTLAAAAAGGLFAGALLGASQDPGTRRAATESSGQASVQQRFTFLTPTATPRDDHPSPDLGQLTGVEEDDGSVTLLFDRLSVHGSAKSGYRLDNESRRIRKEKLADDVTVTGGQQLTGSGTPRHVPVSTLIAYLRDKAGQRPLLVWLRYDGEARVTEVQEEPAP